MPSDIAASAITPVPTPQVTITTTAASAVTPIRPCRIGVTSRPASSTPATVASSHPIRNPFSAKAVEVSGVKPKKLVGGKKWYCGICRSITWVCNESADRRKRTFPPMSRVVRKKNRGVVSKIHPHTRVVLVARPPERIVEMAAVRVRAPINSPYVHAHEGHARIAQVRFQAGKARAQIQSDPWEGERAEGQEKTEDDSPSGPTSPPFR